MLDSEVHRLKAVDRAQKEGVMKSHNDNKRMAVMLSMSQEQISQVSKRNETLHSQLDTKEIELNSLKKKLNELEKENYTIKEDKRAIDVISSQNTTTAQNELLKQELEIKNLQETVTNLRKENELQRIALTEQGQLHEVNDRKAFELRVAMETRLTSIEEELSILQGLRAKETKSATSREYDISSQVVKQKLQIQHLEQQLDSERRTAFENFHSLQIENRMLTDKTNTLQATLTQEQRGSLEIQQRLSLELSQKKEELELLRESTRAREKVLDTQVAKFCSDLVVAQGEVNFLVSRENLKNEESVNTIICLNSELNATTQRLSSTQEEVESLKELLRQKEVNAVVAKEKADNVLLLHTREHSTKMMNTMTSLNAAVVDLQWNKQRLESAEQEVKSLREEISAMRERHQNELHSLQAEISGYKLAVKKLETHINENVENLLLTEANQNLTKQVEHLKNQLINNNNALANARVEADISDNYRLHMMQEHVEDQLKRVNALERERQSSRPLLNNLVKYFNESQQLHREQRQFLLNTLKQQHKLSSQSVGSPFKDRQLQIAAVSLVEAISPRSDDFDTSLKSAEVLPMLKTDTQGELLLLPDNNKLSVNESDYSALQYSIEKFFRNFGGYE